MSLSVHVSFGTIFLLGLFLFGQTRPGRRPPKWRCPLPCNCTGDSVLCDGSSFIPNTYPSNVISVSFRRCSFKYIPPGSFAPSQTLQILLFTSSSFDTISDDAFLGLKHLEYLFIENNKIKAVSGNAFRGLKSLVHLSLANNRLESLPRGLFLHLPAVKQIDLRGNPMLCNCQMKWLIEWMNGIGKNVAVWPPLPCAEPSKLIGRNLSDLTVNDFYCVSSNLIQRWTFKLPSLSVKSFQYLSDQYVVITHPFEGRCTFMEWDHVAYVFRQYDSIKGASIVSCLPLVIGDQLFVVVAQLFGGSYIYRFDSNPGTLSSFRLFQKLPDTRKPNDVEYFRSTDNEHYFVIADSAKSGASTLYKWDGRGFYTHQKLPHWHRDTDAEPLLLSGSTHLIMSSGSQRPVVYRFEDKRLRRLTDIPEAWDVYAVKHFTDPEDGVFACLVSYIGESSLVRWDGSMFRQLQQLPSRGSHVFQPLMIGDSWHALLGHDFGYAFVYQLEKWKHWEIEEGSDRERPRGPLVPFQELRVLAARAFSTVQVRGRQFVFVASVGGDTVVYEYVKYENNI
ncbi:leucine-rich glioma-inactivated protein 1-like [Spea bombifrons]|uniref:leucine-rich glioma-inactivated protein 1-like n=1 Tax=Spea bombifrons TaxID=233779 RepID=UPI00234AD776|nr:leucine-rich glioma-inactivated protein 1-like [Spea bombifrons]